MKKKNKQNVFQGAILGLVGVFLIYWAQTHSPNNGIGNMIKREFSGSYTLSESWYYVCLGLGIVAAVLGLLKVYKSIK